MKRIYEYEDLQPILEQLLQDRESGEYNMTKRASDYRAGQGDRHLPHANSNGISGDTFSVFGY